MASTSKIAVIGAGLAGLAAAYRLSSQRGLEVSLFEAKPYAGGRVKTLYLENGSYEELGAKYLSDGVNPECLHKLLSEFGLQVTCRSIDLKDRSYMLGEAHGPYYPIFQESCEPTKQLYDQLSALKVDNMGLLLDHFIGTDSIKRELVEEFMRSYEGRDSDELATWFLTSFWDFYKDKYLVNQGQPSHFVEDYITGGNSQLVERLVEQLEGKIQYSAPLQQISRNQKGDFQLCFPHEQLEADLVVLALPCSVMRDIAWESGLLPADQEKAIHTMLYGTNNKILVPVSCKGKTAPHLWVIEGHLTWLNHDQTVLTFYSGGRERPFDPLQAIGKLNALFPNIAPLTITGPIEAVQWGQDPYSKGSFCSWGPGQFDFFYEKIDILGEKLRKVFRPIDNRLFFAGEHTSNYNRATMEGAVESGERAARMILKIRK